MIRTYIQMLIEEELPDAVGKMKQFASWFTHGVPGGAALRKAIYESKSAAEILGRVEEFFEARVCGAGAPPPRRLAYCSGGFEKPTPLFSFLPALLFVPPTPHQPHPQ